MVLFSHGLGGSRNGYKYLRTCWTGKGYATIFLQHPGSDESLLQGVSPSQAVRQLRDAATRKNMELRTDDVTAVSDRSLRNDPPPIPKHHRTIEAITTAFFDAYLHGNKEARIWLRDGGTKEALEPQDTWQTK